MAQVILRPASDISASHTCSTGSNRSILISDNSDSTYIYQTVNRNSATVTSTFHLNSHTFSNAQINSVTLYVKAKRGTRGTASVTATINGHGVSNQSLTTTLTEYSAILSAVDLGLSSAAIESSETIEPTLTVSTTGASGSFLLTAQTEITEAYVIIDYDVLDLDTEYSVSASSSNNAVGTASVDISTAHFGDSATFTAVIIDSNYKFIGWYEGTNQVSTDLIYTTTIEGNLSLMAQFNLKTYIINIEPGGNERSFSVIGLGSETITINAAAVNPDNMTANDWTNFYNGNFSSISSAALYNTYSGQTSVSLLSVTYPYGSLSNIPINAIVGLKTTNSTSSKSIRWFNNNPGDMNFYNTVPTVAVIPYDFEHTITTFTVEQDQTIYYSMGFLESVTFHYGNGIDSATASPTKMTVVDDFTVAAVCYEGWEVDKWAKDSSYSNVVGTTNPAIVNLGSSTASSLSATNYNIYVIGKTDQPTAKITLDNSNGSITYNVHGDTVIQGTTVRFTGNVTRENFAFDYWMVNGNNSNITTNPGDIIITEDSTIKIAIKRVAFNVTFGPGGGTTGIAYPIETRIVGVDATVMTTADWENFYAGNFSVISTTARKKYNSITTTSGQLKSIPLGNLVGIYSICSTNSSYPYGFAALWSLTSQSPSYFENTAPNVTLLSHQNYVTTITEDGQNDISVYYYIGTLHQNIGRIISGLDNVAVQPEYTTIVDTTTFAAIPSTGKSLQGWYNDNEQSTLLSTNNPYSTSNYTLIDDQVDDAKYTNIIDTVGYSNEQRIKPDGGLVHEGGMVSTGFIDLSSYDTFPITIRTYGVDFNYETDHNARWAWYADISDEDSTYHGFNRANDSTEFMDISLDSDGNLTLTISAWPDETSRTIRFCGDGQGEDLLVTINQVITKNIHQYKYIIYGLGQDNISLLNNIYVGNTRISDLYVGNTKVSAVYIGTIKIYG